MNPRSVTSLDDALLSGTLAWVAQLTSTDPSDFGRVTLRTSEAGERLLTLLWDDREGWLRSLDGGAAGTTIARINTQLIRHWVDWAYERNQFFDIDANAMRALRHAHEALARGIAADLAKSSTFEGFARTAQLLALRYAERLARVFRTLQVVESLRGRGAEYSPELQLEVLGLKSHTWTVPIVDLGCGADAALVVHLREMGLEAIGIDRRAAGPNIIAKDWFDVRFEPKSIGTIISHLAFSLQFLHHHWHPGDRAYDYARKYMEILGSLVPGGQFCYTPGLPFIEDMLDETTYRVNRLDLPEPLKTTIGSLRDIGTGHTIAYACQVERI